MKSGKYLCICTECDGMVCYYTPRTTDPDETALLPTTCPNQHYTSDNPVAKWRWNQ